jgi:hypothetical protein
MAPLVRRRTTVMVVVAGLLLAVVVGVAWFVVGSDDPALDAAPGATTADAAPGPDGPEPATTAGSATTEGPASAGEQADGGTGANTSGPPAPPAPACPSVISDAEAVAALGAPVARVEARDGFLVRTCTFWSSGDRYLLVQVSRGVAASRDQFELSQLPGDRAVAGIGQAARWTRGTGLLDVLDGGARFQVGLFTPAGTPATAADPPARLEAAARAIAARL